MVRGLIISLIPIFQVLISDYLTFKVNLGTILYSVLAEKVRSAGVE